eukprot:TRINITY_DN92_c1_g3_i1.p1 TRINITY_DN92_c1_g3~~TRINITY_DN92_c1_g3_i1.p1  ORF type:complete len:1384 (+),score=292.23 TRINITY_DN92_c1_g3_i1:120-4271(+)
MPFPDTLGPFGVSALPLRPNVSYAPGEHPAVQGARHGWYSLDTWRGTQCTCIGVSFIGSPALRFDGVHVAEVVHSAAITTCPPEFNLEAELAAQSSADGRDTPQNAGLRPGGSNSQPRLPGINWTPAHRSIRSPGQESFPMATRAHTDYDIESVYEGCAQPATLTPDRRGHSSGSRLGRREAERAARRRQQMKAPNPPRFLLEPANAKLDNVSPSSSGAHLEAADRSGGSGPRGSLPSAQNAWPGGEPHQGSGLRYSGDDGADPPRPVVRSGMRVLAVNDTAVQSGEQLAALVQAAHDAEKGYFMVVQDDASAPLLSLHDAGVPAIGLLSPAGQVTLDAASRKAVGIPLEAETYRMAYPLCTLDQISDDVYSRLPEDDPVVHFITIGGFVYFGPRGEVLAATALVPGETMHFDGPFPWRMEYTQQLRDQGRLVPTTLSELRDAGAHYFAYIIPGETLGEGSLPPWRLSRHGGFVYIFDNGQGAARTPALLTVGSGVALQRKGSAVNSPKSPTASLDGGCFFVMLGSGTGTISDDGIAVRICPFCRTQQKEDPDGQEIPGAMRCDNCGQLSALDDATTTSEKLNLLQATVQLSSYMLLLVAYLMVGALIMRACELDHDEELSAAHNATRIARVHNTARNLCSALARESVSFNYSRCVEHTRNASSDLLNLYNVPAVRERVWTEYWDAFFHVFTMVITIPDVLPQTVGGRIAFVFYIAGGLICVLNVIVDLANVMPTLVRSIVEVCRTARGIVVPRARNVDSEALFAVCDYDNSQSLTLPEFMEYLQEYEGGTPVDPPFVRELMCKVDDGSGELSKDEVMKAIVLWEQIKAESRQVPRGMMVVMSLFGNLSWIFLCAWLFTQTEGHSFSESLWLCFLTLTTIGFGDFSPQSSPGQAVTYFYFLVGLGSLAWLFGAIGGNLRLWATRLWQQRKRGLWCTRKEAQVWGVLPAPVKFGDPSDTLGILCPDYPCEFEVEGNKWPSVMHYIIADRYRGTLHERSLRHTSLSLDDLDCIVSDNTVLPRHDWNAERDDVMLRAQWAKLTQITEARDSLLSTGDRALVYETTGSCPETYEIEHWGTGADGKGSNRLGELLQMLRLDLRTGRKTDLRPGVSSRTPIYFYGYSGAQYAMLVPSYPSAFRDRSGTEWRTVDHFYQAHKFLSPEHRTAICNATARDALKLGRRRGWPIHPNWDQIRLSVMREANVLKFMWNPRPRQVLLQSGTRDLVYDDKEDDFWGSKLTESGDPGGNALGLLLVEIREEFRRGSTPKQMLQETDKRKATALAAASMGAKLSGNAPLPGLRQRAKSWASPRSEPPQQPSPGAFGRELSPLSPQTDSPHSTTGSPAAASPAVMEPGREFEPLNGHAGEVSSPPSTPPPSPPPPRQAK